MAKSDNEEKKNADKAALIQDTIAKIEKLYGKGSIMRLGDKQIVPVDVISSGCLTLDLALGIGGWPRGRIVEIFGPESSGKTTVALHAIASCQQAGGAAAFIDAEHALDPIYAEKLGVDINNLYVSQPDDGEQALNIADELVRALNIADELVRSAALDLIVIDSVAALTPRAELDGEMGQSSVGVQARLMSQALRKLTGIISKSNTCVIFINQIREKVGVMFGNPETTPGGRALRFGASVRVDIRKGDAIKDGTAFVGNRTKAKIVKNKLAPPFKTAEFDIIFGKGISQYGCVLDLAVEKGLITKKGSFFKYNDDNIGQGRENTVQYLADNPELADELIAKIKESVKQDS